MKKYFALLGYRRKLGPALVQRYGRQQHYTANQVRVTAEKVGLNLDYACYGLAAFCDRYEFSEYHSAIGESCEWAEMRAEAESYHLAHHDFAGGHHAGEHADFGSHHDAGHDFHGHDHGSHGDSGHH